MAIFIPWTDGHLLISMRSKSHAEAVVSIETVYGMRSAAVQDC